MEAALRIQAAYIYIYITHRPAKQKNCYRHI